jgi:hypothetical protein
MKSPEATRLIIISIFLINFVGVENYSIFENSYYRHAVLINDLNNIDDDLDHYNVVD